ncbi:flavocytochrome C sulfide dehydrogenase [Pediococcus damnosus]|uniref:Flavocytochrome C sulfide dehydrogenase n=2 Tax=Pediococcus damnosus TaxID=51663 RepID=A0ABM6A3Z3_9LACO|nr:hypothetical protein [Pediococcus damnosus]AMV66916.1 flavocytochrome C sulfide dehydrogenase [Pediococcus damnosus]
MSKSVNAATVKSADESTVTSQAASQDSKASLTTSSSDSEKTNSKVDVNSNTDETATSSESTSSAAKSAATVSKAQNDTSATRAAVESSSVSDATSASISSPTEATKPANSETTDNTVVATNNSSSNSSVASTTSTATSSKQVNVTSRSDSAESTTKTTVIPELPTGVSAVTKNDGKLVVSLPDDASTTLIKSVQNAFANYTEPVTLETKAADAAAPAGTVVVTADNFLDYFKLNGTATYNKGVVTFTSDNPDQSGNVTLKNKISTDQSFTLTGQINLGNKSQQAGADGLSLGFHDGDTDAVGMDGGSLGFGGLENAFGWKADTYWDSQPINNADTGYFDADPQKYHNNHYNWFNSSSSSFGGFVHTELVNGKNKAITEDGTNGTKDLTKEIKDPNGQFKDFTVSYNGTTKSLTVTYDGKNWNEDVSNYIGDSNSLSLFIAAATGTSFNLQQLRNINLTYVALGVTNIQYVDDDNNGKQVGDLVELTSGNDGTATWDATVGSTVWKKASIANSENYKLAVGQDTSGDYTFDVSDNAPIVIHLNHVHSSVLPDTFNGKTTAEVTYSGAGENTPSKESQTVTWTTDTDMVTGAVTYIPNKSYTQVDTPDILGYTPTHNYVPAVELSATTEIPSDVETVNVNYMPNTANIKINYVAVDNGGNQVLISSETLEGFHGEGSSYTATVPTGYHFTVNTDGAAQEVTKEFKFNSLENQTLTFFVASDEPQTGNGTKHYEITIHTADETKAAQEKIADLIAKDKEKGIISTGKVSLVPTNEGVSTSHELGNGTKHYEITIHTTDETKAAQEKIADLIAKDKDNGIISTGKVSLIPTNEGVSTSHELGNGTKHYEIIVHTTAEIAAAQAKIHAMIAADETNGITSTGKVVLAPTDDAVSTSHELGNGTKHYEITIHTADETKAAQGKIADLIAKDKENGITSTGKVNLIPTNEGVSTSHELGNGTKHYEITIHTADETKVAQEKIADLIAKDKENGIISTGKVSLVPTNEGVSTSHELGNGTKHYEITIHTADETKVAQEKIADLIAKDKEKGIISTGKVSLIPTNEGVNTSHELGNGTKHYEITIHTADETKTAQDKIADLIAKDKDNGIISTGKVSLIPTNEGVNTSHELGNGTKHYEITIHTADETKTAQDKIADLIAKDKDNGIISTGKVSLIPTNEGVNTSHELGNGTKHYEITIHTADETKAAQGKIADLIAKDKENGITSTGKVNLIPTNEGVSTSRELLNHEFLNNDKKKTAQLLINHGNEHENVIKKTVIPTVNGKEATKNSATKSIDSSNADQNKTKVNRLPQTGEKQSAGLSELGFLAALCALFGFTFIPKRKHQD